MFENDLSFSKELPDVALERPMNLSSRLDWVGMVGIEIPIKILSPTGEIFSVPARVSSYVSLDQPEARGIHMSRLFKFVQEGLPKEPISMELLKSLLGQFLESHRELSASAKVEVAFQALVERKALKSENFGWRTYPVRFLAEQVHGKQTFEIEVVVTYSSTCPASAALSRQLIQQNFVSQFKQKSSSAYQELDFQQVYDWLGSAAGINATPHAQRSFARLRVQVEPAQPFGFLELIDAAEEALQTPVQTVVKREDEQEFALRNGQNLMFCEDAARRLIQVLSADERYLAYSGQVSHVESLHPHDAVSIFSSPRK